MDLMGLVVLVEMSVVGCVGRVLCCEILQVLGVSPGAAETAVGEGDQDADGEHERVALGFGGRDFYECADAGIRSLNEVAIWKGGQREGGSRRGDERDGHEVLIEVVEARGE